jgi:hypothetical protein
VAHSNWASYDSLGDLIEKFNAAAVSHTISKGLVHVRDALAHGRMIALNSYNPDGPRTLIKFAKPNRTKGIKRGLRWSKCWMLRGIRTS